MVQLVNPKPSEQENKNYGASIDKHSSRPAGKPDLHLYPMRCLSSDEGQLPQPSPTLGTVTSATTHSLGLGQATREGHSPLRNTDTNPQPPWEGLVAFQGRPQTPSPLGKLPPTGTGSAPALQSHTGLAGGGMGTQSWQRAAP